MNIINITQYNKCFLSSSWLLCHKENFIFGMSSFEFLVFGVLILNIITSWLGEMKWHDIHGLHVFLLG